MFSVIYFFFNFIFNLFKSRKALVSELLLYGKELQIKSMKMEDIRKKLINSDRVIIGFLNIISNIKDKITIVQPETVLKWQRNFIKYLWTFKTDKTPAGRPPVTAEIRHIILEMKNSNHSWGSKRIQGELLKLGIELDKNTIQKIVNDFRKQGKIKPGLTWKQFLSSQIDSIYAMDFFTVDTLLNQRFYVHFVICHKTREIIQFAIIRNPVKEFVRQQLIGFKEIVTYPIYLIHDNTGEFKYQNYFIFDILGIATSVKVPNMNAIPERFIRSIRTEALDYYLLFSESKIRRIIERYVEYYNQYRPHQGIYQKIPCGNDDPGEGRVKSFAILGGLHHHYYREAA